MIARARAGEDRSQKGAETADDQQGLGSLDHGQDRGRDGQADEDGEGETGGNQRVDPKGEEGHEIECGDASALQAQAEARSKLALTEAEAGQPEADQGRAGEPGLDRKEAVVGGIFGQQRETDEQDQESDPDDRVATEEEGSDGVGHLLGEGRAGSGPGLLGWRARRRGARREGGRDGILESVFGSIARSRGLAAGRRLAVRRSGRDRRFEIAGVDPGYIRRIALDRFVPIRVRRAGSHPLELPTEIMLLPLEKRDRIEELIESGLHRRPTGDQQSDGGAGERPPESCAHSGAEHQAQEAENEESSAAPDGTRRGTLGSARLRHPGALLDGDDGAVPGSCVALGSVVGRLGKLFGFRRLQHERRWDPVVWIPLAVDPGGLSPCMVRENGAVWQRARPFAARPA